MPGTLIIDPASFSAAIVMATAPKTVFGAGNVQDKNAAGVPKWTANVAVTYSPDGTGIAPPSEVLSVTITSTEDPGTSCPPGTSVTFDQLRAGISPPEKRDDGRVRGGRLWYSAAGIKPAQSWSRGKSDAA
jgi:hypothetical protein